MIDEAKRLAAEGRAVYVITTGQQVKRFEGMLGPEKNGIKVECLPMSGFDWRIMRTRGSHPNCEFLVDHQVIEEQFGAAYEMLHRFDLPLSSP
jgi:hypothetical protein